MAGVQAQTPTIRVGSINISRDTAGDKGYTLNGAYMTSSTRQKLLNTANFGSSGTVNAVIQITDDFATSGSMTAAALANYDVVFVGVISGNGLTATERDALYTWSKQPGKVVVLAEQAFFQPTANRWGYSEASPTSNPTTREATNDAAFKFFQGGPFGNVAAGISQAGGSQGYFTATCDTLVIGKDNGGAGTIVFDVPTRDVIIADTDFFTVLNPQITNVSTIATDSDKLWGNMWAWVVSEVTNPPAAEAPAYPGGVSSSLTAWYNGSKGVCVTNSATSLGWTDLSGNSRTFNQTTAGAQPAIVAAGLNYNRVLRFDGSNDQFTRTGADVLPSGTNNYTIFAVAKPTATSGGRAILGANTASSFDWSVEPDNQVTRIRNSTAYATGTAVLNSGPARLLRTVRAGTSFTQFQNALADGTGTNAISFAAPATQAIGSINAANYFGGDLAEIAVYSSNLSATDVSKIESYLSVKYGLTLGGNGSSSAAYLASDGSTVWTAGSGYHHDVAGIGRDDTTCLDQRQSMSSNATSIIEMANTGFAANNAANTNVFSADKSYLMWGHDGDPASVSNTGLPSAVTSAGVNTWLNQRVWRAQESGTVGVSKVRFPATALPSEFDPQSTLKMIVSTAAGFGSGVTTVNMTKNGNYYEADVNFASGVSYFTFGQNIADTDGDGLANFLDRDDDNDGIIDITEMQCPTLATWTDWTTVAGDRSTATGTLALPGGSVTVTLGSSALQLYSIQNIGWTDENFAGTMPTTYTETIQSLHGAGATNTITFSSAVDNPIVTFYSNNGNTFVFDQPFEVVGTPTTQTINSTTSITGTGEGQVALRFIGAVTSISYTSTLLENWTGVSVGAYRCPDPDTDNDGIVDRLDLDSDGDGIPDHIEAQSTSTYIVGKTNIATPADSDNDGTPDYLDLDSNNFTGNDTADAGLTLGTFNDADGDGLDDDIDSNDAAFGPASAGITNLITTYPHTFSPEEVDWRFKPVPGSIGNTTYECNLVKNGDFATGNLSQWTSNGGWAYEAGYAANYFADTTQTLSQSITGLLSARDGSGNIVLTFLAHTNNSGRAATGTAAIADLDVYLGGTRFVNIRNDATMTAKVSFHNGASGTPATFPVSVSTVVNNPISVTIPWSAGLDTALLEFRMTAPSNADDFAIDNISIEGDCPLGLAAWYKADAITGGTDGATLQTWEDSSLTNFDITQATTGSRPVYYKTTANRLVNFNPSLFFSDAQELKNLNRLFPATSGFSLFGVGVRTTTNGATLDGILGMGADGNYPAMDFQVDGNSTINGWNPWMTGSNPAEWGGSTGGTFSIAPVTALNQPILATLVSANHTPAATNNIESWLNGYFEQTTLDAVQQTQIGNGLFVGSSGGEQFIGMIPEVVIYNGPLSDRQVKQVQTYLAIKYGITLRHDYTSPTGADLYQVGSVVNGNFTSNRNGWTAYGGWTHVPASGFMQYIQDSGTDMALSQAVAGLNHGSVANQVQLRFKLSATNYNGIANSTQTATLAVKLGGTTYATVSNPNGSNTITLTAANSATVSGTAPTPGGAAVIVSVNIPWVNKADCELLEFVMTTNGDDFYLDDVEILGPGGFDNRITGIGREDCAELYQKQSLSQHGGLITIGANNSIAATNAANTAALSNGSYLVFGDDNGSLEGIIGNLPGSPPVDANAKVSRVWKAVETGSVGSTRLSFPTNGVAGSINITGKFWLVTADDAAFTQNVRYTDMTSSGSPRTVDVDLVSGTTDANNDKVVYFSIAGEDVPGPGCVTQNLRFWLKGDYGLDVSTDGAAVGQWADVPNMINPVEQTTAGAKPTLRLNGMNWNPALDFDNGDWLQRATNTVWAGANDPTTIFTVSTVDTTGDAHNTLISFGGPADYPSLHWHTGRPNFYIDGVVGDFGYYVPTYSAGFPLSTPTIFNAWAKQNGDTDNIAISVNGIANRAVHDPGTNTFPSSANALVIGGENTYGGETLDGLISEVIVYNRKLSDDEIKKVNSYLAIKYGVTLSESYLDPSGGVIYPADGSGAVQVYDNRITGLGREDCTTLNQKQSRSVATGNQLSIALVDFAANNTENANNHANDATYFIIGDNNAATAAVTLPGGVDSDIAAAGLTVMTQRKWRAVETGNVGAIRIRVPKGAFAGMYGDTMHLLVTEQGGADSFATLATAPIDPVAVTASSVEFVYNFPADSDPSQPVFFTFAGIAPPAPGCVTAGMRLWLRADESALDATGDGAAEGVEVAAWTDQASFLDYTAPVVAARPRLRDGASSGAINFNPSLDFDANEALLNTTYSPFVAATDSGTMLIVVRPQGADGTMFAAHNGVDFDNPDILISGGRQMSWTDGTGAFTGAATIQGSVNLLTHALTNNASGADAVKLYRNGAVDLATTATGALAIGTLQSTVGEYNEDNAQTNADIAEVVVFNRLLPDAERWKVETYLAIKYGITLPVNYVSPTGATLFSANGGTSTDFDANVFGIAREVCSGFHQKQAKSINAAGRMTIGIDNEIATTNATHTGGIAVDSSYLIIGDNAATGVTNLTPGGACVPPGNDRVTNLVYKVQETGTIETTKLTVDLSGFGFNGNYPVFMQVSDSSTFTMWDNFVMTKVVGSTYTANFNFDGTKYVRFSGNGTAPANLCTTDKVFKWFHRGGSPIPPWNVTLTGWNVNGLAQTYTETVAPDHTITATVSDSGNTILHPNWYPTTNYGEFLFIPRYDSTSTESSMVKTTITMNKPAATVSFSLFDIDGYIRGKDIIKVYGKIGGTGPINPKITLPWATALNSRTKTAADTITAGLWSWDMTPAGTAHVAFDEPIDEIVIEYTKDNHYPFKVYNDMRVGPITVKCVPPAPVLPNPDNVYIFKEVDTDEAKTDEVFTYKFTLQNLGCENRTVNFADTLPGNLKWVADSLATDLTTGAVNGYGDAQSLTLAAIVLPPGTHYLYASAKASAAGAFTNQASYTVTLSGTTYATDWPNLGGATDATPITIVQNDPAANITITKSADLAQVQTSGQVVYTFNITNNESTAVKVNFQDNLQEEATYVAGSLTGITSGTPPTAPAVGAYAGESALFIQGLEIPANDSLTFSITADMNGTPALTDVVNYATITPDAGQGFRAAEVKSNDTTVTVVNDVDGDGVSASIDVDDDNDGVPDSVELANARPGSNGDSDGDGLTDDVDPDSDNDGISDAIENGGTDANGDGRVDGTADPVTGQIGTALTPADTDGDGRKDSVDLDSDNDGITDVRETNGVDANKDGMADSGLTSGALPDTDLDGVPDVLDLDSDNDGLSDMKESGYTLTDANGDSIVDGPDADNDGLRDSADANDALFGEGANGDTVLADTDSTAAAPENDGIPNYRDTDSDGDSQMDIDEAGLGSFDANDDGRVDGTGDTDGDGILNVIDSKPTTDGWLLDPAGDVDGDGITNAAEGMGATDTDGDGVADALDKDSDNDGILDAAELATDRDGDGVPNFRDLDSDNDGINDVREANGTDADNDGLADGTPDTDGSPVPAGLTAPDTDADGRKDYLDLDSDNDGVSDLIENGASNVDDLNGDGVVDGPDADNDGIMDSVDGDDAARGDTGDPLPRNTDSADLPDYRDLDSDNDGTKDIVELAGLPDANNDGKVDGTFVDADNDGIADSIDSGTGTYGGIIDPNGDADGDGLTNGQEGLGVVDTDGDGVPDYRDADTDNDGISDMDERSNAINGGDTDGDGKPDFRDLDSDNDGINDVREANGTDANGDGKLDGTVGTNGMVGTGLSTPDTDNDGRKDYTDLDSDNDSVSDLAESGHPGLIDANFDGVVDGPDADGDGIRDSADGNDALFGDATDPAPRNTDADADADFRDTDSDGDGTNDIIEAGNGALDTNGDGKVDPATPDADNDGIPDVVDTNDAVFGGLNDPLGDDDGDGIPNGDEGNGLVDSDGDGVPDSRDLDTDNDGILDSVECPVTQVSVPFTSVNGATITFSAPAADQGFVFDVTQLDNSFQLQINGVNLATQELQFEGGQPALAPNVRFLDGSRHSDGVVPATWQMGTVNAATPIVRVIISPRGAVSIYGSKAANGPLFPMEVFGAAALNNITWNVDGANTVIASQIVSGPTNISGVGYGVKTNPCDSDGDGVPNHRDLDSDNDGINDVREAGGTDANNDGRADGTPDSSGRPVPAGLTPPNSDTDSKPDYIDLDSDNDGVSDLAESGNLALIDANGDGVVDGPAATEDTDGDGIMSSADGTPSTWGDASDPAPRNTVAGGRGDYADLDGATVVAAPTVDADGDGIADSVDTNDALFGGLGDPNADDDNDGLTNGEEGGPTTDTDGDGVPNYRDLDSDNDGIRDSVELVNARAGSNGDTDGDGKNDWIDLDSDNDGINDVREANGTDVDNDGLVDGNVTGLDTDGDGLRNSADPSNGGAFVNPPDTDGDGRKDYVDLDSDNDTIGDLAENAAPGVLDANNDGIVDGADSDNDGIRDSADGNDDDVDSNDWGDAADPLPTNTDGDTGPVVPDYRDLDSNNDGTRDIVSVGNGGLDTNNDGKADGTDADNDGVKDPADANTAVFGGATNPLGDTDGDGYSDFQEGPAGRDTDGDGVEDRFDLDSDNDGIPDATERANSINSGDTDGDGVLDFRDLDSDNDGISDVREAGGTDPDGNGLIGNGAITDTNHDGLHDPLATTPLPVFDTDLDGRKDYLDIDSDNDTLSDLVECGCGYADADNNGLLDGTDTDGDGIVGEADSKATWGDQTDLIPDNSDAPADSLPDYRDLDSDQDGTKDVTEAGNGALDANNDGRVDATTDTDSDGAPDVEDALDTTFGGLYDPLADADGDGIPNGQEGPGNTDSDGDGVPDYRDLDSDNDGITDAVENAATPGRPDTDGDGVPNFRDLDSDNDGINDAVEAGGTDANGDGRADGTPNATTGIPATAGSGLTPPDTDGDGAKNFVDLDSDNDSISDLVESGAAGLVDANNNGVIDGPDADGDGIMDSADALPGAAGDNASPAPANTDGAADGANYIDPDSNNDGTKDIVDAGNGSRDVNGDGKVDVTLDADKDGIADIVDGNGSVFGGLTNPNTDTDGDGLTDAQEGPTGTDTDGDGVPDAADLDSDNDGILDSVELANARPGCNMDTDCDGIPDFRDLDSDNDGINDVREAGGTDANGDGKADGTPNSSGVPSSAAAGLTPPDTDGDGRKNYVDLDSDGDSVPDLYENGGAGAAADTNRDGLLTTADTGVTDADGDGIMSPVDGKPTWGDLTDPLPKDEPAPDTDTIPNYLDPDSDGDGLNDINEAGNGALDANNDGKADGTTDADADGIIEPVDTNPTAPGGAGDPAGDYDGDGMTNGQEGNGYTDTDGDGIPNQSDLDSDNDGIPDATERANAINNGDSDGDGITDWLDLDSDNDGINDVREAGHAGLDANGDGKVDGPVGTNGLANSLESNDTQAAIVTYGASSTPRNTDGDGKPDYLDLDSDNDSISDLVESGTAGLIDANNDGVVDGPDTDGDGIMPSADGDDAASGDNGDTAPADQGGADTDATPDYLDGDSDGDGTPDITEAGNGAIDTNNDGRIDSPADADGDGIADVADANDTVFGGLGAPTADADGDGIPNNIEGLGDTDGDGIPNAQDLDSDNDGIPDATEGATDTDGDGKANFQDLDSDNDGINDVREAGHAGADTNGDGKVDGPYGSNGLADSVESTPGSGTINYTPRNTDGDAQPDYLDLDSDNDSVSDLVESGTPGLVDADRNGVADGPDADGDGIVDSADGNDAAFGDQSDTAPVDQGGADTDTIPDYIDTTSNGTADDIDRAGNGALDANNDGAVDGAADADHDGILDPADTNDAVFGGLSDPAGDNDGDGIPNSLEGNGLVDTDGDGIPDSSDADSDNDGISDATEKAQAPTNGDTDGDGVPNWRDLDSDNDGINDVREAGGTDANGDGKQDGTPGPNGMVGAGLTPGDADGDSKLNYLDLDSDNDGISDLVESGNPATDANQNGVVDGPDTDGDGIMDSVDASPSFGDSSDLAPVDQAGADADTTPDYLDRDSDGDGINDIVEAGNAILDANNDGKVDGTTDADGDGINDAADTQDAAFGGLSNPAADNDGDGIPNSQEGNGVTDTDGDGVADNADADSDGDGISDATEKTQAPTNGDTDGDGVPNWRDLDSDNDGINDVREAAANGIGADANNDGIMDGTLGTNGMVGAGLTPANFDNDGKPNYLDLDSDNDTISDLVEYGSAAVKAADTNFDGLVDGADADGDGIRGAADGKVGFGDLSDSVPVDQPAPDADTMPDYLDIDSNGDGTNDIVAAGNGSLDTNGDGMVDSTTDTDGDGIPDVVDSNDTAPGGLSDPAGDNDGDGIPNSQEGNSLLDTDGDGVPNSSDADSDNDGISDVIERTNAINNGDTDGDGVKDWLDLDSDNDGINDVREAGGTDANGDGAQDGTPGANGMVGAGLTPLDSDGDGRPNYLDLDSDNDSASDLVEAGLATLDPNNDGIVDGTDPDGDGIRGGADGLPATRGDSGDPAPTNTDGADTPDYIDLDSDNDGARDIVENGNGTLDANNDGKVDDTTDPDGDGVPNVLDTTDNSFGGIANPAGDNDSDGIPNNQEGNGNIDTDGDGVSDMNDPDSDNDGILDGTERAQSSFAVNNDTDGDGLPNWRDLDSDNDGLNDVREATASGINRDTNNDGIVDGTDSDHDGLMSSIDPSNGGSTILPVDSDGDGAFDYIDLDADNDLVSDVVEGGAFGLDANDNGVLDSPDSDGDGITDSVDGKSGFGDLADPLPQNTDGTDLPDYRDLDSDNDGAKDITEAGLGVFDPNGDGRVDNLADDDHDGIPNEPDTADTVFGGLGNSLGDNDLDGIPNGEEGNGLIDTDGDGVTDNNDRDSDGDGIMDIDEYAHAPLDDHDTDNDGIPNHRDIDSDNDGINDVREANGTDANNDGKQDGTDTDTDGLADPVDASFFNSPLNPPDTDSDGRRDYLDLDSDNDTVSDLVESGHPGLLDVDNNGVVDGPDADSDGIADSADGNEAAYGDQADPLPVDQPAPDTDSVPDYRDLDSDGDGAKDITENGKATLDANNDGRIDNPNDTDADGIPNVVDASGVFGGLPRQPDNDGDGMVDSIDPDDDNDGTPDVTDAFPFDPTEQIDTDGDGIGNNADPNDDNDSAPDATDAFPLNPAEQLDSDGDGTGNNADTDDDNDGIVDATEGTADTDGDGIPDSRDLDSDNDGIPDATERVNAINSGDTDGDGVPDYRDLDSDNDGINDVREAGHAGADANGDGRVDGPVGANGLANGVETADTYPAVVTYPSATPTTAPLDSDGDGRPDYVDLDSDNDGRFDITENGPAGADTNGDGIADGTDTDGDGIRSSVDGAPTVNGDNADPVPTNTDGTDVPNYRDTDSNNDGTPDISGTGLPDLNGDGRIDAPALDTDSDGSPNVADTDDLNFGGSTATPFQQWQTSEPDDSGTPAGNSDGDDFDDLAEYALGGDPSSGSPTIDGAPYRRQGLCVVEIGSALDAIFERPAGRTDVTYTLEKSADLSSWTDVSTAPTVTTNGDGTETVRFAGLQSIAPLTAEAGFVRLRMNLSSPASVTRTKPVGWCQTTIAGRMQTYGLVFVTCPQFSGKIDAVSTNGLNVSTSLGALNALDVVPTGKSWYLEIVEVPGQPNSPLEGYRFDINRSTTAGKTFGVTLDSEGPSTAGLVGARFVIREHWTIGSALPVGKFHGGFDASSSDQVMIYNGAGFDTYWLIDLGAGLNYWSPTNDPTGSLPDANNTVIEPGVGMFVRHGLSTESSVVRQIGEVRANDFRRPVGRGFNFVSTGFPTSASPLGSGMTPSAGLVGGFDATSADQILAWRGDSTPNLTGYDTYWLFDDGFTPMWFWADDPSGAGEYSNAPLFKGCRASFVLFRGTPTSVKIPQPWTP